MDEEKYGMLSKEMTVKAEPKTTAFLRPPVDLGELIERLAKEIHETAQEIKQLRKAIERLRK